MKKQAVNIKTIAQLAKCSSSTVSRVLSGRVNSIKISDATKMRILEVCEKMDYHPCIHASRMFSRRSATIGFLIIGDELHGDDNLSRSMFAVFRTLFQRGYRALPLLYNEKFSAGREHLNIFKRQEIDGMIIWGARKEDTFIEDLKKEKLPFVLLSNSSGLYPDSWSEQSSCMKKLVDICRERGARRFASVFGGSGAAMQMRREGLAAVAEELKRDGLEYRTFETSLDVAGGEAISGKVMDYRPDAVICGNDVIAVGVENAMLNAGLRIPDDVMITGFDNIRLSQYCQIPITTFDQMAELCAESGVKMLLDHLDGKKELSSLKFDCDIIERASTARS